MGTKEHESSRIKCAGVVVGIRLVGVTLFQFSAALARGVGTTFALGPWPSGLG
jgi:hypothetical protein